MTFKDQNRPLQELARELSMVRAHNLRFKEGDPQNELLMFAEAGLVCMTLEHFVRAILAPAGQDATLFNLLQMAVARALIRLPWEDQQDGIRKTCAVRNSLLHANFEQAAADAGCASVSEYFKTQYASELETMYRITEFVMNQVDTETGRPRAR